MLAVLPMHTWAGGTNHRMPALRHSSHVTPSACDVAGDLAGLEGRTASDLSAGDMRDAHRALYDAPTKPQICFDFTKGMCMRGDKCKFSHDLATIVQFNSKEKGAWASAAYLCRSEHPAYLVA